MITKALWKNLFYDENIFGDKYVTNSGTAFCLIASVFTIPLDIILFPFEIIIVIINYIFSTGYEKR